eukprot:3626867-Amphidinium_carterae.2
MHKHLVLRDEVRVLQIKGPLQQDGSPACNYALRHYALRPRRLIELEVFTILDMALIIALTGMLITRSHKLICGRQIRGLGPGDLGCAICCWRTNRPNS